MKPMGLQSLAVLIVSDEPKLLKIAVKLLYMHG